MTLGFFLIASTCVYVVSEQSFYDTEHAENTNTQSAEDTDSERQIDDEYVITTILTPVDINFLDALYYHPGDTKVKHIPIRLHCPPPNIS